MGNFCLTYAFMSCWVVVLTKRTFYTFICWHIKVRVLSWTRYTASWTFLIVWFVHWTVCQVFIQFFCFRIRFDETWETSRSDKMRLERRGRKLCSYTFFSKIIIYLIFSAFDRFLLTYLILWIEVVSWRAFNLLYASLKLFIEDISFAASGIYCNTFVSFRVICLTYFT